MNYRRMVLAAVLVITGVGSAGAWQPDTPPEKTLAAAPTYRASKYDLARAYLRIERLMVERAKTLSDQEIVRVNRGVDSATNYFFRGDFSGATRVIAEQIVLLEGLDPSGPSGAMRLLSVMDRPVTLTLERGSFDLNVRFIAEPTARGFPFSLHVDGSDEPVSMVAPNGAETVSLAMSPERWPGEGASVRAIVDGKAIDMGKVSIIRPKLVEQLEAALGILPKLEGSSPHLSAAIRLTRARLELLINSPTADSMAMYVLDPGELGAQVIDEVNRLSRGEDPFKNFTGDRWLAYDNVGTLAPMRLSVPKHAAGEALPLIIAVHGAGGDENLWMDGYGGGMLKTVAMERGCILATPQVGLSTFMPATFDAIVDSVASMQNVDRSRVYLVGHSLGGGVITSWMKARADKVRAGCSIASVGVLAGSRSLPPVLAIAGELDRVVSPGRIGPDAARARGAGHFVEYREISNYGHTLVVGKVIPEMVDWLLAQQKPMDGGEGRPAEIQR